MLKINATQESDGISIEIKNKKFNIKFPKDLWQKTPKSVRDVLFENLVFGNTHYLPLIFDEEKISYNTRMPLFESFLFKNQLYDLLCCEKADNEKHLEYVKNFYNLEFEFARGPSGVVDSIEVPKFNERKPVAIIPFSFGKESLLTFAICLELGIKPVLVYCQEPVQPYEEKYKIKKLKELSEKFNVDAYFIKNDPGLFRYGKAFNKKLGTELGWGTQTTLLAMLCVPFVYAYKAKYIFFGSEYSNNETSKQNGWNTYPSYDQTADWTTQQNNIVKLLTNNQCGLNSSLEPLEEINIFYILHHRYPEIGKFQFSCSAENPLYENSQWCHKCYKCSRIFLFAQCCGIDPYKIGFKEDLLRDRNLFPHYFGKESKSGSIQELDFSFYSLCGKKDKSPLTKLFETQKLPSLKPWLFFREYYGRLKPELNLPKEYRQTMRKIFSEELKNFSEVLPKSSSKRPEGLLASSMNKANST
ncbi:hypothetical protein HZC20_03230 [Candidatus Peregrinibacteria bacterium]|nr:hypothetical protein [Candidatus Peregrinibacteria bacterium]